jgi:hypothetical protein
MEYYNAGTSPDLHRVTLDDYLALKDTANPTFPNGLLFRHDNIMTMHLMRHSPPSHRVIMNTHWVDDPWFRCTRWSHADTIERVGALPNHPGGWLVDVDLDYFTNKSPSPHLRQYRFRGQRFEIARKLFTEIKKSLDMGRVCALTIALSQSYTGGWRVSRLLCDAACEGLGINYQIRA